MLLTLALAFLLLHLSLLSGCSGSKTPAVEGSTQGAESADVAPFVRAALANPRFAWRTVETTHFRVHAPTSSHGAGRLDSLATAFERARAVVQGRLDVTGVADTGAGRADIFVIEGGDDMRALVGQPAGGWTEPGANAVLVRTDATGAPPVLHELGHLYSHRVWGAPAGAWVSEGVALYAVGHCAGAGLHAWAAAVGRAGLTTSLESMGQRFDFSAAAPHLEAGSFVTFVRDRHGVGAVRSLWTGGLTALSAHTGTSAAELERLWRADVATHARAGAALDPRGRVRCETWDRPR